MEKQPNTRFIGVFIAVGVLFFLSVMAKYLQEKYFSDDKDVVVMYFEESVKGLSVGSSVVFKGVEVGRVSKISLVADSDDLDFSISVLAVFLPQPELLKRMNFKTQKELLSALIRRGLRARLISQNYLTGQLMIELEMLPKAPLVLKQEAGTSEYFEIPTILSPFGEISKGVQSLPIKESLEKLGHFFDTISEEIPVIMPKIAQAFENLNKMVVRNSGVSTEALVNLNAAVVSVNEAAKSVRNFMDYMEQHPEAILQGKKGGRGKCKN